MRRILLVDDEVPVLEGLRLRLRCMAEKWDMQFAGSAARALDALQERKFDVIVSDMRMPGMDGAQLLQIVRERWPHMVRVALSGYAEAEQTLRLVSIAHQYLNKPCEPQTLENVIERVLSVKTLLQNAKLRSVVGGVGKLPPMPRTYAMLEEAMAAETASMQEIARIVSRDTVIAAKVIQMVNSAFFRLRRRITKVEHAVSYLGLTTLRNLVLSAEVFTSWPAGSARRTQIDLEQLQEHSLKVAAAAQALTADTPIANDAFLAALLHDIGYWILSQECAPELGEALEFAAREHIPLEQAEAHLIGASHAEMGAYLLGIWGLPYRVIEAVAHHHAPQNAGHRNGFDPLAAVAVAHVLTEPGEGSAFGASVPPHSQVDEHYLSSVQAPFDWLEAKARIAAAGASES